MSSLKSLLTSAQKAYKAGEYAAALDCCKRALRTEGGEQSATVHLTFAVRRARLEPHRPQAGLPQKPRQACRAPPLRHACVRANTRLGVRRRSSRRRRSRRWRSVPSAARSSSSPTTGRRVCSAVALAVVGVARMLFMFYGQAWKGMAALTLTHETQPKPKP